MKSPSSPSQGRGTERLPDLDEASLACMRKIAKLAGIRSKQSTLALRSLIQIEIREAMRAVLPPGDPRHDTNWPFNQPGA